MVPTASPSLPNYHFLGPIPYSSLQRANLLTQLLDERILKTNFTNLPSHIYISSEALLSNKEESNDKIWAENFAKKIISQLNNHFTIPKKISSSQNHSSTKKEIDSKQLSEEELLNIKKLTGHIHGDLFIGRSGLEGLHKETITEYLAAILKQKIGSSQTTKEITWLHQCIERGLAIQQHVPLSTDTIPFNELDEASQKMCEALTSLKANEGLLIGCGWTSISQANGHSIYFLIIRNEHTYTLRAFNAGEGIEYQDSLYVYHFDAQKDEPLIQYKFFPYIEIAEIQPERITHPQFWRAAFEMTACQKMFAPTRPNTLINPMSTNYEATDIYKKLFPLLQGKINHFSVKLEQALVSWHHSGTCSYASLKAVITGCLPQPIAVSLEHELEIKSLQELLGAYSNTQLLAQDEQACRLLSKAAMQLPLLASDRYTKKFITLQDFKFANELATHISKHVQEAEEITKKIRFEKAPEIYFKKASYLFSGTSNHTFQPITPLEISNKLSVAKFHPAIWTDWKPNSNKIAQDLKIFHEICEKTVECDPEGTTLYINEIFSALPIPKSLHDPFWSNFSESAIEICMGLVLKLSELLISACQKNDSDKIPERRAEFIIALFKGQAIQHKLASLSNEMRSLGVHRWNLYSNNLYRCFTSGRVFCNEDSLEEILTYLFQTCSNPKQPEFFDLNGYNEGLRAYDGITNDPLNEAEFAFRYFLENRSLWNACSLKEQFDSAATGTYLLNDNSYASFALQDLSGAFFPKKFCLLKKHVLFANSFLEGTQIENFQRPLKVKVIDQIPHATLNQQERNSIRFKADRSQCKPNFSKYLGWQHHNPYNKIVCLNRVAEARFKDNNSKYSQLSSMKFSEQELGGEPIERIMELGSLMVVNPAEGGCEPTELRILKALDYFNIHLDYLREHDYQIFFRQIMFRNDNLEKALENNPELASRILTFLQKAYSHHIHRKDINAAVFIIYLTQCFQQAIQPLKKKYSSILIFSERLLKEGLTPTNPKNEIETLKGLLKLCSNPIEKSVIYAQILFGINLDWAALPEKHIAEILPEIISWQSHLQSFPIPREQRNPVVTHALDKMRLVTLPHHFYKTIKDPSHLKHILKPAITVLGMEDAVKMISWDETEWIIQYPYCIGSLKEKQVAIFNISTFFLQIDGANSSTLPAEIVRHKDFIHNFSEPPVQVKSLSLGIYEFNDSKGMPVRVFKNSSQFRIQKEFNNIWFEYIPYFDGIHSHSICNNFTAWISTQERYINFCHSKSFEIRYCAFPSSNDQSKLEVYDKSNNYRLLASHNEKESLNHPYDLLKHFEEHTHINVWINNTGEIKCIELPRMQLKFDLKPDPQGKPLASCRQITGFHISEKQHIPALGSFNNYLVLKNDEFTKVIIPQKPIQNVLRGGLSTDIQLSEIELDSSSSKYSPYMEYVIDEKGELRGLHESDDLFLAYLYLAQSNYLKASELIKKMSFHRKRFSPRENIVFRWIIALQDQIQDNDPKFAAVILKAMALYWQNRQIHGKNPLIPLVNIEQGMEKIKNAYLINAKFRHYLGATLLQNQEELILLQEFAKYFPKDNFIARRLQVLLGHESPGTELINRPGFDISIDSYDIGTALLDELNTAPVNFARLPQEFTVTRPDHTASTLNFQTEYKRALEVSEEESKALAISYEVEGAFSKKTSLYAFLSIIAQFKDKIQCPSWEGLCRLKTNKPEFSRFVKDIEKFLPKENRNHPPKSKTKLKTTLRPQQAVTKENLPITECFVSSEAPLDHQKMIDTLFVAIDTKELSSKLYQEAQKLKNELQKKCKPASSGIEQSSNEKLLKDIEDYGNLPLANFYDLKTKDSTKIETAIKELEQIRIAKLCSTKKVEENLLALANKLSFNTQTSDSLIQTQNHIAEVLSTQKTEFAVHTLCTAFLQNDADDFIKKNPHLSIEDILTLRKILIEYLILVTEEKAIGRQKKALSAIHEQLLMMQKSHLQIDNDLHVLQALADKAHTELSAKRAYDPTRQFPFLVFEYASGLCLRSDQVKNINSLNQATHMILQAIMATGKSKVFLVILAFTKINQNHLTILLLPPPLYETISRDLRTGVLKTYDRFVHTLHFRRQSEFSIENLTNILNNIFHIRARKECLIMTPKSFTCLFLKFKEELINYRKKPHEELRAKLILLQNILRIVKGNAIADEIDLILNSLMEVNFTIDETVESDKNSCQLISGLYSYLCDEQLCKLIGTHPLESYSLNAEQYHKLVKPFLIEKITEEALKTKDSLGTLLANAKPNNTFKQIMSYLHGNATESDEAVVKKINDVNQRNILASLRQQINVILPCSLDKKHCVDYGKSKRKVNDPKMARLFAIPYSRNDVPIETSEFRSPELTGNLTSQMWWKIGLDANEINRCMQDLASKAAIEAKIGMISEELTVPHQLFKEMCGENKELHAISLFNFTSKDCQKICAYLNDCRKTNPKLFFNYICNHIISKIKIHPHQLTSNAIDLADSFQSFIGFSGTPWNIESYLEKLRTSLQTTPGIDGKSAVILYEKTVSAKDGIRIITEMHYPEMLDQLVRRDDDALIDVGTAFSGYKNEDVAQAIYDLLKRRSSAKKGVVFFQNDVAVVLEGFENCTRIVPLQLSALKPHERFTYFDQAHSTGSDILQALNAKATLTLGKDVTLRDAAQGAWRLRDLDRLQSVSWAVLPEANVRIRHQFQLKNGDALTFADILWFIQLNQAKQQLNHLIASTKQKIDHVVKRAIDNFILDLDLKAKNVDLLIGDICDAMISKVPTQPFESYGMQEKMLPALTVIAAMKSAALKKLEAINDKSPLFVGNKNHFLESIAKQMDLALGTTIKLLPKDLLSGSATEGTMTDCIAERELEKESQRDLDLELLKLNQTESYSQNKFGTVGKGWWILPECDSIDLLNVKIKHAPAIFSSSMYVSQNLSSNSTNKIHDLMCHCTLKQCASLMKGLLVTSSRVLPGFWNYSQLPAQYVLFIKEKSGPLKLILIDVATDLPFFWSALSIDRKEAYPKKGNREVQICLCNLNGAIVQHDRTIKMQDPNDPFMQAYKKEAAALRVQAKIALGEFLFTEEEFSHVQSFIKEHDKKLILELYTKLIASANSGKSQLFCKSPLYKLLQ